MCAQWIGKDPSFLHANSENSDKADLSLPWAHMPFCLFVSFFLCLFLSFFLSFFDEMYIRISLNYAVIKQVLSSKQCISFFLFIKIMDL